MPWMRAVTAIRVVVARMIPSSVRKLRSLFLRSESRAIRVASQKEALKPETAISIWRRDGAADCSRKSADGAATALLRSRLGMRAQNEGAY